MVDQDNAQPSEPVSRPSKATHVALVHGDRDTGTGIRYMVQCVQYGIIGYYVHDDTRETDGQFITDPSQGTLFTVRPTEEYLDAVRRSFVNAKGLNIGIIAVGYTPMFSLRGEPQRGSENRGPKTNRDVPFRPEFGLTHPLMVP